MQQILEILCASGSAAVVPLIINFVLLLISELMALSNCNGNGILHQLKMIMTVSEGVLLVEGGGTLSDNVELSSPLGEFVAQDSVDAGD